MDVIHSSRQKKVWPFLSTEDADSRLKSDRRFLAALARWIVALHPSTSLSRLSSTHSMASTFSYLTRVPEEQSLQYVLDAWMSSASPEQLREDRRYLLEFSIPQPRLRQILMRILRLIRKVDGDSLRRSQLFRGFFCQLPDGANEQNLQTALSFCEMERALPCITTRSKEVRAGPTLFHSGALQSSVQLQANRLAFQG